MKRLGIINALRGLSALAIVLYHVRIPLWEGWSEIAANPAKYSLFDRLLAYPGGACHFFGHAVMLFFVLSGFCIHYPYAAKARPLQLKPYATRRFLRIYPPYLAAVALSVFASYLLDWSLGNPPGTIVWRSASMTQNYPPGEGQFLCNPALWSLPVEMELYLAYPIFLFCLKQYGLRISTGLALLVSIGASVLANQDVAWIIYNFARYWIIWCSGAWVAEKLATNSLPACGRMWTAVTLLSLGLAMTAIAREWHLVWQQLIWGGFFFLLLAWFLRHVPYSEDNPSPIGKALNGLGLISYSLYLTHYPFLAVCGKWWENHLGSKPVNFLVPLAFTGLAIVFATIFYIVVERPCHHWARRLGSNT
tara:strand:- start:7534 stop:8622 length:1089 start_codon:yes stop_codon:yes gene_type:complete